MSGARIERTLSQADFDHFARISGDNNPIHVDAAFSAGSRFGRPVAHGLLLISILGGLAQSLRPGARITGQQIRFPAPTFADEPMVFEAALEGEDGGGARFACRVSTAEGVITCDGMLILSEAG